MAGWSWILLWLLLPTALWLFTAHPWVFALVLVGFFAQRFLPDPYVLLRTGRRVRALQSAVDVNADNVTARRDLAMLHLDRRRPARAARLLEEAMRREPDSAEVKYLLGVARLRTGAPEEAVRLLDEAVRRDPKLRYGDPFLQAGVAYARLGRVDEAVQVLERFVAVNGSSVEGLVRLARARGARGDAEGRRQALEEARRTFGQLPAFQRRKQWAWYLRSLLP